MLVSVWEQLEGNTSCIEVVLLQLRPEKEEVQVQVQFYEDVVGFMVVLLELVVVEQIEATSTRKHHTQYDPISLDHFDVLDSWVEEEPSSFLDEDDLDFLNIEGAAEIIEEEKAGEQLNVGEIPTEGIKAINEANEDDDADKDYPVPAPTPRCEQRVELELGALKLGS
ncbi:hypothetical protein EJ110_NYTH48663 [Nymphaea thermarum]|nr:hypothetical protein EJ110_NYTH48663 [Nymphaea thermarum]